MRKYLLMVAFIVLGTGCTLISEGEVEEGLKKRIDGSFLIKTLKERLHRLALAG